MSVLDLSTFGPRHRRRAVLILGLAALIGGCGKQVTSTPNLPKYEVKGKVFQADGKPLPNGTIEFHPVSPGALFASGPIESDGGYTLGAITPGEGAVVGDYKVKVTPLFAEKPGVPSKTPAFPEKYKDESTTDLTAKVEAKPNSFDFTLKPPSK